MPFAFSDRGRSIAYDVSGSGPDLLLLHGLCSFRERWHRLGYVAGFARTFRVITMDFAGHGQSAKPHDAAAYALEHVLNDVGAVLDAAGARSPAVLGFSYGGRLALHLGAERPLRAVTATGARFGPAMSAPRVRMVAEEWDRIAQLRERGAFDPGAFSGEARVEAESNDARAVQACALAFGAWPDLQPADVRTPSLFLVGDRDGERFEALNQWRSEIERNPAMDAQILPGADHAQTFLDPQRTAARIEAFFNTHR